MKETITKSDWLAAQQCVGMAWYGLRAEPAAPDEAESFRMQQGQEIGALARKLYPTGVIVSPGNRKSATEMTQAYAADRSKETIFEAIELAAPFAAKADILKRLNNGWHVLEVKSNFSDTKDIEDLIDDLSYTVMVFTRAGLPVVRASLLLLSRVYHFGNGPERLFEVVDKTREVLARAGEFDAAADSIAKALFRDTPPEPKLSTACRQCSVFGDTCLAAGLAHTVLEIPNFHSKKIERLAAEGIIDLSRVPDDLKLTERQQRVKDSAVSGKVCVEPRLRKALNGIAWPCYYLDFETVATFLPLYPGHACHQQVPTQFSIHRRDRLDSEVRHSEYLADASRDCQRDLAEALIGALGRRGSILVYTSFEKTRIGALQSLFPDLKGPLQLLLDRIVDSHSIIADYVYHPDFRGSFSIKSVLPALVPELSYQNLAIRDGEMAVTRFARMARGEIVGDQAAKTRLELLEYCKLDTLAMVRLHEALDKMAA